MNKLYFLLSLTLIVGTAKASSELPSGASLSPASQVRRYKAQACITLIESFLQGTQNVQKDFEAIQELYEPALFDADKVYVTVAETQYNLGEVLDTTIKGLSQEITHANFPSILLTALFYKHRTNRSSFENPRQLMSKLLSATLVGKASAADIKTFIDAGFWNVDMPFADDDDDCSLKEFLKNTASASGPSQDHAQELCKVLGIAIDVAASSPAPQQPGVTKEFYDLFFKALADDDAFEPFAQYYRQGGYNIDTVSLPNSDQTLGAIFMRSHELPEDRDDRLIELFSDESEVPSHISSSDELCNLVDSAIDTKTFREASGALSLLKQAYRTRLCHDVDTVYYHFVIDPKTGAARVATLGEYLNEMSDKLNKPDESADPIVLSVSDLVYEERSTKGQLVQRAISPHHLLVKLVMKAIRSSDQEDMDNLNFFYKHLCSKGDVDQIDVRANGKVLSLAENILKGLQDPKIAEKTYQVLKMVENGRTKKNEILAELFHLAYTNSEFYVPLLNDWLRAFNIQPACQFRDRNNVLVTVREEMRKINEFLNPQEEVSGAAGNSIEGQASTVAGNAFLQPSNNAPQKGSPQAGAQPQVPVSKNPTLKEEKGSRLIKASIVAGGILAAGYLLYTRYFKAPQEASVSRQNDQLVNSQA